MEISPVAGIRAVPVVKARPADHELLALFDIESSTGPGNDSYSGSGKRASGGQDDESDELEEGVEDKTVGHGSENAQGAQVNYFA
jgi:hypothetical protein